jgi:hypothetical protein
MRAKRAIVASQNTRGFARLAQGLLRLRSGQAHEGGCPYTGLRTSEDAPAYIPISPPLRTGMSALHQQQIPHR